MNRWLCIGGRKQVNSLRIMVTEYKIDPKIVCRFEQQWILNAFFVGFLQNDSQIALNLN